MKLYWYTSPFPELQALPENERDALWQASLNRSRSIWFIALGCALGYGVGYVIGRQFGVPHVGAFFGACLGVLTYELQKIRSARLLVLTEIAKRA